MIIVMSPGATEKEIQRVVERVERDGLKVHLSQGEERTVIGTVGDVRRIDQQAIEGFEAVERVVRVLQPFKLASRDFHPTPTVVDVAGVPFGGNSIPIIAGPCSVENETMLLETARFVRDKGGAALRGGAYKPRTSPYSFQGLGRTGLEFMADARRHTGLPVVTEVLSPELVEEVAEFADLLQIGARNMQNFTLLKEVGQAGKPVLLKRGHMATIEEWLLAAEYILAQGNSEVILCERGIRTFETQTRNTLDLSAVPVVKRLSHLPVVVDPSHGTGHWDLVTPMAIAGIAAGADGLIVEIHPNPGEALSDGSQSLKFPVFADMVEKARSVARALGRDLAPAPANPRRSAAGELPHALGGNRG